MENWGWVELRAGKYGKAGQEKALYGFWELYFGDNFIVGSWNSE